MISSSRQLTCALVAAVADKEKPALLFATRAFCLILDGGPTRIRTWDHPVMSRRL